MINKHRLNEYVELLKHNNLVISEKRISDIRDSEIDCLTYDSRAVVAGTLFICKGAHFKEEYLSAAVKSGAIAYVSETEYDVDCPCIAVSDIRKAMAYLSVMFFDRPSRKITGVGITGTKGKSTTAYYIKAIFDDYFPEECAVLSSIDNYDGVIREESHLTTQESVELQRHFRNAVDSGISHIVLEVSSQALKYDRMKGTSLSTVCFTNIGSDHISPAEHSDFEDYFSSKLKIFALAQTACVNSDMQYASRVLAAAAESGCKIIRYGSHVEDEIYCSSREAVGDEIRFSVKTPDWTNTLAITMPGMFNVENALAAVAVAYSLGIPYKNIARALYSARVPGRMEVFKSRDGRVSVIVDYAHNKMSFEALFKYSDSDNKGLKRIVVFGCPGGKAFLRRKDLGETAGRYCGLTVLTEEDAGEEPVHSISEEIARYVSEAGGEFCIIDDRGEAIRDAILNHGSDKIVYITGKGRETRQKRGTAYIETPSDIDYAEMYLKQYDKATAAAALI